LAVFLIAQATLYAWEGRVLDPALQRRMARLLGIFIAASLYLVTVYHLTNAYYARQQAFERFLLLDGEVFPTLFWAGYVMLGGVAPLAMLFHPKADGTRQTLAASLLVLLGAFAFLYVFIIGGQSFPLEIFPGHAVSSSFGDGQVAQYRPSLPEFLLGVGGLGAAFLLTLVGIRAFDFMPQDDFVPASQA
ncbi:MAG: hypothetical protein RL722_1779, partial [Pseudomonadota bacterium]